MRLHEFCRGGRHPGLVPVGPNQGLVEEAIRAALEKDSFVNGSQIRIGACLQVFKRTGTVRSNAERDMAERDAWCVFGIDDFINEIKVNP